MIYDFKSVFECIDNAGKALRGRKVIVTKDGDMNHGDLGTVIDCHRRKDRFGLYATVRFKDYSKASYELRHLAEPLV